MDKYDEDTALTGADIVLDVFHYIKRQLGEANGTDDRSEVVAAQLTMATITFLHESKSE